MQATADVSAPAEGPGEHVTPRGAAAPGAPQRQRQVATDALFVALHLAHVGTPVFQDPGFSLETDRGFGEVYQYVKEYWVALLLLSAAVRHRAPVLGAWALLFGYLLADDAFMLHERAGTRIATRFAGVWPLDDQHVGELAVACIVAALAVAVIALAHAGSAAVHRRTSRRLLRRVGLFAFFAIGVDLLHGAATPGAWNAALAVVEEAGELAAMTAILWLVTRIGAVPGRRC